MKLEHEVPTRAQIAGWLAETPKKTGTKDDKKSRNSTRRIKVKGSVPDDVFEKVESDFLSYPEWEIEEDEPNEA